MGIFNERLKNLRDSAGIKSNYLASELGIAESRLSYYMSGDREPSFELLIAMANFFGVSTDYLVGRSSKKNYEEEKIAESISAQAEKNVEIQDQELKNKIEKQCVDLHDILVKYAEIENLDDAIWIATDEWIKGISHRRNCIGFTPPNYPLDEAKTTVDLITNAQNRILRIIGDMCTAILDDETVDKRTRERIKITTKYSIASLKKDVVTLEKEKTESDL